MTWAAPLWLLGLLPWSAVVLYLLWGRRRRTDVPFLDLWQTPAEGVRVRRRVSPPPVALALAVVAMLLAILAAGRPAVRSPWGGGATASVVIDRGYTMSALGAGAETRTRVAIAPVEKALEAGAPLRRVERLVVPGPGPASAAVSDLSAAPAQTPTALDTRDAMRVATRAALAGGGGPVVAISDQPLGITDARLIEVPPWNVVRNAGIVLLAARETPAVQVMVRVRAAAGMNRATVRVTSDGVSAEGEVDVSADAETDAFIDLPQLGDFLKAELIVSDDHRADDTAWLAREASWPRLEARAPLPAHVQRMVEVYARQRPVGEASRRVVIVRDTRDLPAGEAGVVLAPVAGAAATRASSPRPDVNDHPITRGVTWADVGMPAVAGDGPPAGWTPVVSAAGKVWVAVREQPIRAVWIGFETADWARSAEFVVFWANVFSWAGAGGERFVSHPVGSLEGGWQEVELAGSFVAPEPGLWPGLYRRADGTLRALHAPDVPFPAPRETNWRARLDQLARDGPGRMELAPILALLAVACLLLAAAAWKPRTKSASAAVTAAAASRGAT